MIRQRCQSWTFQNCCHYHEQWEKTFEHIQHETKSTTATPGAPTTFILYINYIIISYWFILDLFGLLSTWPCLWFALYSCIFMYILHHVGSWIPLEFRTLGTIRKTPKRPSPTRRTAAWSSGWSWGMRTRGSSRKAWTSRTGPLNHAKSEALGFFWREKRSWRFISSGN